MLEDIYVLMEEYSAMVAETQPLIDALDAKKKAVVSAVMEHGETVEHGNVKAEMKSGYNRESWDGRALVGFAAVHPEILAFQKVTAVKPTVAIKVS